MLSKGTLESMLALRGLCYDALSAYENVTVHDFAAREDWVLNLNNYKDTLHYGQWINDAMVEEIAAGRCAVTDDAAILAVARFGNAQMQREMHILAVHGTDQPTDSFHHYHSVGCLN